MNIYENRRLVPRPGSPHSNTRVSLDVAAPDMTALRWPKWQLHYLVVRCHVEPE